MENGRIEDLKRRIQKDPGSIAFAQLGEEYRRAGRPQEAIDTCRAGLKRHPGYLSARVTLGRALLEVGEVEQAEHELTEVLRLAPENLAALRGVADAVRRRGDAAAALKHYELALALAPRDPELQQTVETLREELRPREVAAVPLPVSTYTPPEPTEAEVSAAPEPSLAPATASSAGAAPAAAAQAPVVESSIAKAPSPSEPSSLLPVLESWLDFIIADRQQRLARAHGAA